MSNKVEQIISLMKASPKDIEFPDLLAVCVHFLENHETMVQVTLFLKPRSLLTSRVNIQKDSYNKAKAYKVKQVLQAIERMKREQ